MRARNLKPSFFKNEELASLPFEARLLFQGLWCLADCEGRLEDRTKRIEAEVFPYDEIDTEALLSRLHEMDFIVRYWVEGKRYIQVRNFLKHQNPHKSEREKGSEIPCYQKDVHSTEKGWAEYGKKLDSVEKNPDSIVLNPESLFPLPDSGILTEDSRMRKEETQQSALPPRCEATHPPSDALDPNGGINVSDGTVKFAPVAVNGPAPAATNTRYDPALFEQDFDFESFFETVYARHPNKRYRKYAHDALAELLIEQRIKPKDFDEAHAKQCASEAWTWKNGAKAPYLHEWIQDRGYKYVTDESPPKEKREYPRLMM